MSNYPDNQNDKNNWQEKKKELMREKNPSLFADNDNDEDKNKTQESKSNSKNNFERKDDESFDDYINRIRSQYQYDPRPDLTEDSQLWEKILKIAEARDEKAYNILHGFRCGGAKLEVKNNKVIMQPRIGENHLWQSQQEYNKDRKEWLMPLRESIGEIFDSLN